MTRREFNRQATIKHIAKTFISLSEKYGVDGFTVDALCRECGITKSTFYRYYKSKKTLAEMMQLQSGEDCGLSQYKALLTI